MYELKKTQGFKPAQEQAINAALKKINAAYAATCLAYKEIEVWQATTGDAWTPARREAVRAKVARIGAEWDAAHKVFALEVAGATQHVKARHPAPAAPIIANVKPLDAP